MSQSMPVPRRQTLLPEAIDRRLTAYALAAGATSVGMLSLSSMANAEIIYTPANDVIGPQQLVKLDLNQDGRIDFSLANRSGGGGCSTETGCDPYFAWFSVRPTTGNGAEGFVINSLGFAFALKSGNVIGRHHYFNATAMALMYKSYGQPTYLFGSWPNVKSRYLGLRFKIDGENHFGWARLNVKLRGLHFLGHLTGYAYETIPHKSIKAGQTQEGAEGAADVSSEDFVPTAAVDSSPAIPPMSLGALARGRVWDRRLRPGQAE